MLTWWSFQNSFQAEQTIKRGPFPGSQRPEEAEESGRKEVVCDWEEKNQGLVMRLFICEERCCLSHRIWPGFGTTLLSSTESLIIAAGSRRLCFGCSLFWRTRTLSAQRWLKHEQPRKTKLKTDLKQQRGCLSLGCYIIQIILSNLNKCFLYVPVCANCITVPLFASCNS